MKKILGLSTALVLCVALAASAAQAGKAKQNVVEPDVRDLRLAADDGHGDEAHRRLVEQDAMPRSRCSIVPVDVNSVHDKLLTSFVGGTAADIIHDEAADIAGFTAAGLPGEPDAADPEGAQGRDPEVGLGHGQLRPARSPACRSCSRPTTSSRTWTCSRRPASRRRRPRSPWTWTQFRAVAKKLSTNGNYGVCWGLRSPTATIQTISLNWGGQWNYLENGKWVLKVGTRRADDR